MLGLILALPTAQTAQAADQPQLNSSISSLAPTVLHEGDEVTLSGTITNPTRGTWTDVRVYLAVPRNPYTTFHELDSAYHDRTPSAGNRVVTPGTFATIDKLDSGSAAGWTLTVPYSALPISGAEGVYPVTVQIVATSPSGDRDADAVSSATTFLPLIEDTKPTIGTNVVIPLVAPSSSEGLQPIRRTALDSDRLSRVISAANSIPVPARTIILDPELLDLISRSDNTDLLTQLVNLVTESRTYILGYAHPDETVLAQRGSGELEAAIDRATRETTGRLGVAGARMARVESGMLTQTILSRTTEPLMMVSPADLPGWTRADGPTVNPESIGGSAATSLLVNARLADAGKDANATIERQRLLSTAALTAFAHRLQTSATQDVAYVLPVTWDPGRDPHTLGSAFGAAFLTPVDIMSLIDDRSDYTGKLAKAGSKRLSRDQVAAATKIRSLGDLLARSDQNSTEALSLADRQVAAALSTRWVRTRDVGVRAARAVANSYQQEIDSVTVSGPTTVTLSSASGSFPLTISNQSQRDLTVGVHLEVSNKDVEVPHIVAVDVGAGERRTVDVAVDMADQQSTVMIARPASPDGIAFGSETDFNVRASNVGAIIWIAMGIAAFGVVATMARRFRRSRRESRETT